MRSQRRSIRRLGFAPCATALAGAIFAPAAASAAVGHASAGTVKPAPHVWRACEFITKAQITTYTQWQIDSETQKPYALQGATGHMCLYESSLGTLIVFLPDLGSPYPGNDALGDSANHFERTIDDVSTMFTNGTISMTLGHTDVAVRVVPMDLPASYQDVEPFAGLMIKHAAKYLPH